MKIKFNLFYRGTPMRVLIVYHVLSLLFFGAPLSYAAVIDNFESGSFSSGWVIKNIATIRSETGNKYAYLAGAEAGDGYALGGYLGSSAVEAFADFSIQFRFRFAADTGERQMCLQIGNSAVATTNNGGSNIFINFAYDGVDNRFEAYNGSSWVGLTGLPSNIIAGTWYTVTIVGRHFGTAIAQYDVTVNGITHTGIAYFHNAGSATGNKAGGFNFNDRYGPNPGFSVDNVNASGVIPPAVLISESGGNTKVYETGPTSDLFTVALATAPQSAVQITLNELETPNQVLLNQTVLNFDSSNYATTQTVTVTAIDDAQAETYLHTTRIGFAVSSTGADYNGLAVPDLQVTVADNETTPSYPCFSGIYPHLAVMNGQGECGIGAIVDWAGSLWYATYMPHAPKGSSGDKLYQLSPDLQVTVRSESIGGTPANRMIHPESNQLIISNYLIDSNGNVRAIPFTSLYGRMTANARHLTDPANKVYFFTMEDGLYEVDVNTLAVKCLHPDRNSTGGNPYGVGDDMVPGDHGKGGYSGQGRLVVANNGMDGGGDGTLSEWNGIGDPDVWSSWTEIDRNQYTDVTGPGGIYGNANAADDPIWSIGWDGKSVLLQVCDNGSWKRFRLPKASFTQDDADGWFTEWPRIREAQPGRLMMDMHCMLYEFPMAFSHSNTAGITPLATHLKMIVDWQYWNEKLVLACNDDSILSSGSLGGISQSNLRFTSMDELDQLGRPVGWGGPWINDAVVAGVPSEAFLINGFTRRCIHFAHNAGTPVNFTIEVDKNGTDTWTIYDTVTVGTGGYGYYLVPSSLQAQWIRFKTDVDVNATTAYLNCSSDPQRLDAAMFRSLKDADGAAPYSAGIIHPIASSELKLEYAADIVDANSAIVDTGYYVVGADMSINPDNNPSAESALRSTFATTLDFSEDDASVILGGFRLPKADPSYDAAMPSGWPRGKREVVTERNLMNIHGTFYEYPLSLDGTNVLLKIRPITTHHKYIFDFCSWRGMLVMSGNFTDAVNDEHYVRSIDGKTGLWFGNVDDLFAMGIPRGTGGPWKNTSVIANAPSAPYLMAGYDKKIVQLSHNLTQDVNMTIQVDFLANGSWKNYTTITVPAGQMVEYIFPDGYNAHWVRVVADKDCVATAWFIYNPLCSGSGDMEDIACFSRAWLEADCGYCNGADLTMDGKVDIKDLVQMAQGWLK